MRSHSLKFLFLTLLLGMGFFWFSLVDTSHGAQVTSRSDTLNNSNVSATSNQTIAFTTQDNLVSQVGLTASSNFAITFPAGFSLSTLTCDDVNLLIAGSATSFNTFSGDTRTNCLNTGTSWGVSIDPTNRVLLFTTPTSTNQYAWVATGTTLTVNVGSNATFQGTGSHWITNPSSGGTYTLTVGAAGSSSFLGSGDILVSINQASQLSATVAESLTFNVTGMLATKPFVQGGSNSPLSGNTFSKTFSSPNTAGDLIVLGLTWFPSTLTVSSIVDTQGNSYVSVGPPVIMSGEAQQIWYAKNINGGANTVTTTMSGSFSQSSDMVMAEYSGVNTVSPLDVTSSNSGTNGSVADSGSKATNFSNELIYGYGSWNGIGGLSAGSGFTSHTFGVLSAQEDKAVSPIGTYSATSSIGGIPTFTWIMSMATFKLNDATQLPCTADDRASGTIDTSSPTSVSFGNLIYNNFFISCQDLTLSTNAGNGYSISTIESTPLETGNGLVIPNTTCDAGTCTATTAQAWATVANKGFGYTCYNQVNSDCSSDFANGTKFRQFANLAAGASSQVVMSSSTPIVSTVSERVKYRLSIGSLAGSQPAGTYTNLVSWIATPVY